GPFRDVISRLGFWPGEALVCDGARLSHAELRAWSSRLGWRLRDLGVSADARVGLCVARSPALVAGLLGIWGAGGAFVPLDPTYPPARLREMIEDAGVRVVVADAASAARLAEVLADRVVVDVSAQSDDPPEDWRAPIDPAQLAYVIYTSGST